MSASTAWAGAGQAAHTQRGERPAVESSLRQLTQDETGARAEVSRLEQRIARQKAGQREARERSRAQDQTIAELRKQLLKLQTRP